MVDKWKRYAFSNGDYDYDDVELHGIFGFASPAYDYWRWYLLEDNQGSTGYTFAQYITHGYSIKEAWFTAVSLHEKPPWFTGFPPAVAAALCPVIVVHFSNGSISKIDYCTESFSGLGVNYNDPSVVYENYWNEPNVDYVVFEWYYETY